MRKIAVHHKVVLWLGFCVLCGLMAAWSGYRYLQEQSQRLEEQAKLPTVERVVAALGLAAGTVLSEEHLAVRTFPRDAVASSSISPNQYTRLLGMALRDEVGAGEMLLPVHIAQSKSDAFSTQLATGRRAITMPVDQINSLSGLLQAGDLVDLYVSFDHQRRKITAPLLQGVLVLATDEQTAHSGIEANGQYGTITLDLAPEDGAKLVAARQTGIVTAMLRNPHDGQLSSKAVRGDLATLLGINKPNAEFKTVPIIYGNTSSRHVRSLEATPAAPRSAVLDVELPEQLSVHYGERYAEN